MKRIGNLYEKIYDIENLRLAHKQARRGKSFYTEVKLIDENEDEYLYRLQDMLIHKTYHTSKYEVFEKKEGKKIRKIYKLPYFPDRICQWAIIQVIEPYLMRTLTDDTYSALPGRGVERARRKMVRALKTDPENTVWCLKIDISKYYPNVNIEKLKLKYRRLFKDNDLLWLLDEILDSNPDTGVPIGNYISQYSGNIYLSDFDHRVKEVYHIKHYFRYMDDMVFLSSSKEELQNLIKEITKYLADEHDLKVKDSWSLFRVEDRGIDFVGYVFRHDSIRLRKSIAHSIKKTSSKIRWRINNDMELNRHLYFSFNSLKGWLKHSHSGWLKIRYFDIIEDHVQDYHDRFLVKHKEV
nr:MAG TPA: hypothetical protein [Caudoviricetes sp.]